MSGVAGTDLVSDVPAVRSKEFAVTGQEMRKRSEKPGMLLWRSEQPVGSAAMVQFSFYAGWLVMAAVPEHLANGPSSATRRPLS